MKEKGKSNPFAAVLQPDEEILGVYEPESIMLGVPLRMMFLPEYRWICLSLIMGLLSAVVVLLVIGVFFWLSMFPNLFELGLVALLAAQVGKTGWNTLSRVKETVDECYMLTSQRVLTRVSPEAEVISRPLEYLRDTHLLPAKPSLTRSQAIVLCEGLPYWNSLANPNVVLNVIEQARKDRLKMLSEVPNQ